MCLRTNLIFFPLFVRLHRYRLDSNVFLAYKSRGRVHVLIPSAWCGQRYGEGLRDKVDMNDCIGLYYRLRIFCSFNYQVWANCLLDILVFICSLVPFLFWINKSKVQEKLNSLKIRFILSSF